MPKTTVPGPLDGAEFRGKDQELHGAARRRELADLPQLRVDALPVQAGELQGPHDRQLEAERREVPLQVRHGPRGPPARGGRPGRIAPKRVRVVGTLAGLRRSAGS